MSQNTFNLVMSIEMFRKWLNNLPNGGIAGICGTFHDCPIARYITSIYKESCLVGEDSTQIGEDTFDNPKWVKMFVCYEDNCSIDPTFPIGKNYALEILDKIESCL